jgi:hypothetical protein
VDAVERVAQIKCARSEGVALATDIEETLQLVHGYIRPKSTLRPYHGIGRSLEDQFADDQRSIIYGLLLDLIDHVPWKGIDHEEFWRRVCQIEPVRR